MKRNLAIPFCIFVLGFFDIGIWAVDTTDVAEEDKEELQGRTAELELYKKNLEHVLNMSENAIVGLGGAQSGVDLDTWEAPRDIQKNYPYYLSGYDDDSRPIWVAEIGSWNLRKVVEEGGQKLKDFDKYVQQAAHRAIKSMQDRATPDNPVTDAVLLADMNHLNFLQMAHVPTVSYVLHLAREYQTLVSEHIHIGLVVNTNAIAQALLNLVKPVFGRIFEKIEVYGTSGSRFVGHGKVMAGLTWQHKFLVDLAET